MDYAGAIYWTAPSGLESFVLLAWVDNPFPIERTRHLANPWDLVMDGSTIYITSTGDGSGAATGEILKLTK